MELRDFIARTIVEIQHGVQMAIDQTADVKGAVNPIWGLGNVNRDTVQDVNFDIAVTAVEKGSEQGGGEIKVLGSGVGGQATSSSESSHVSRIQFTIPIIPTGQVILAHDSET